MKEITHDCMMASSLESIDSKDRTAVRNSTDLLSQELKEEIVLLQKEARKVRLSYRRLQEKWENSAVQCTSKRDSEISKLDTILQ